MSELAQDYHDNLQQEGLLQPTVEPRKSTIREALDEVPESQKMTDPSDLSCQVQVYSGRRSGQVRMEMDEGRGQRAGQEISPAGVGDRLDSMTKDNER